MAKRYYGSKRSEYSQGKMVSEHPGGSKMFPEGKGRGPHHEIADRESREFYAGAADMNRRMYEDEGMIYENENEIANLPQEVMMKEYPKVGPYLPDGLDDGISGIDRQMGGDDMIRAKQTRPRKA